MPPPLKIGLVTLDTSHVIAFTRLFADPAAPHHIPGARVAAAFPGGSPDIELSHSRVAGYAADLRDTHGVKIMESPEAVAEVCDLLFLMSIDGRVHLDQLRRTVKFRRPTFIDKPFATNSADAKEMFRLAAAAEIPLMSCSALRYADNLQAHLANAQHGPIVGCDVFGPMNLLADPPGFFWYGIHAVEVLVTVMGPAWKEVHSVHTENADLLTVTFADGRIGSVRGLRQAHGQFAATIHREKGFQQANLYDNPRPVYASLLAAIMQSLPQGKTDVPAEQTLAIIQLLEAANESRQTGMSVSRA